MKNIRTTGSLDNQNKLKLECIHGILIPCASSLLPDRLHIRLYFCVFELLTITKSHAITMCDLERGGATKLIIGSSWNNGVKNCLDLYLQCLNLINWLCWLFYIDYDTCKYLSHPAHTHTQTRRHCFTSAEHACTINAVWNICHQRAFYLTIPDSQLKGQASSNKQCFIWGCSTYWRW